MIGDDVETIVIMRKGEFKMCVAEAIRDVLQADSYKSAKDKKSSNDWLTPHEVAVEYKFRESTLACWRQHDMGPKWSKVNGNVRYKRADVEAWLDSHSTSPRG